MGIMSQISKALGLGSRSQDKLLRAPNVRQKIIGPTQGGWESMAAEQAVAGGVGESLASTRRSVHRLYRREEYLKKFIRALQTNVVGPKGIKLQADFYDANNNRLIAINEQIESLWADFCEADNFDAAGNLSLTQCLRSILSSFVLNGEALFRIVLDPSAPHGLYIQTLNPSLIDETLTRPLENGNRIKNGVEINAWGRALAFYLMVDESTGGPDFITLTGRKYFRLDADEAIFLRKPNDGDSDQTRSLPWAEAALESLKMLSGYMEAELVAARVSASKMGFYKEDEEGAGQYLGEGMERDSEDGAYITEAIPGTFEKLPKGVSVQSWDPQHPNSNFDQFVKTCLRKISAGFGVSYSTLSNDLEGANYSSIRAGLLEERDEYASVQNFLVEEFCTKVYRIWLKRAHLKGLLPAIGKMPLKQFNRPTWIPRRWAWVDPLKDASAAVLALNNRLTSRRKIAAENGEAIDDILADISEEHKLLADYGVSESAGPVSIGGGSNNGKSPQLHAV